jgi:hypothetical protein
MDTLVGYGSTWSWFLHKLDYQGQSRNKAGILCMSSACGPSGHYKKQLCKEAPFTAGEFTLCFAAVFRFGAKKPNGRRPAQGFISLNEATTHLNMMLQRGALSPAPDHLMVLIL